MAYKDYRHPDGVMTRMAGAYLWANGEYLGLSNTRADYSKVGPGMAIKYAAGDYRLWVEMASTLKSFNAQTGAFDGDTITGYATSTDGTTWSFRDTAASGVPDWILTPNTPTNPAGGNTDWMRGETSVGTVLYDPYASLWRLYGHGGNNTGPRALYTATSSDGLSWTLQNSGQPILSLGPSGNWDDKIISDCHVVQISANQFVMLHRGHKTSDSVVRIGRAISTDGVAWTKYPPNSPVIDVGVGWDAGSIYPGALFWDATYKVMRLWYAGGTGVDDGGTGLGYAFSEDYGLTWARSPNNPVHTPTAGQLDSVQVGDTVEGYIDGRSYRIHYGADKDVPPHFRGRVEATVDTSAIACKNWNSLADGAAALSAFIPNLIYGDREHALQVTLQTGGTAPVSGGYCEAWIMPSVDGTVAPVGGGLFVRALPMPATANTGRTFEIELTAVCAWPPPYYAVKIVNRCGNALATSGHGLILDNRGL